MVLGISAVALVVFIHFFYIYPEDIQLELGNLNITGTGFGVSMLIPALLRLCVLF